MIIETLSTLSFTVRSRVGIDIKLPGYSIVMPAFGFSLFLSLLFLFPVNSRAELPKLLSDWEYEVKKGDTLWLLTERFLNDEYLAETLRTYNRVENPRQLPVGKILKIPLSWMRKKESYAVVVEVRGAPEHIVNRASRAVKVGDRLQTGEVVTTDDESAVSIRLKDGSLIYLQSNGKLILQAMQHYENTEMNRSELKLPYGKTDVEVAPQKEAGSGFDIKTPSLVTSVRGTRYRLEFDAVRKLSRIMVTEGIVAVGDSDDLIDLVSGSGLIADQATGMQKPESLLRSPDLSGFPSVINQLPAQLPFPAVTGAAAYELRVGSLGSSISLIEAVLENNEVVLENVALNEGHYWMKVRAVKKNGLSGFDGYHEFGVTETLAMQLNPETPTAMSATQIVPQINRVSGRQQSGYISLFWNTPQKMERFRVQISKNTDFDELIVDETNVSTFRYTVDGRLEPGHYYWRVAAQEKGQSWGAFSDVGSFQIFP